MKYIHTQKGFVILFTVLISSIILMIGLGIFSIAFRETILSSTARESIYSLYAADSGIECALFEQSKPNGGVLSGNGGVINCGTIETVVGDGTSSNPYTFKMGVEEKSYCTKVTVFDFGNTRRVVSQGYNICSLDSEPADSPLLVERVLDVVFNLGIIPDPLTADDAFGPSASTIKTETLINSAVQNQSLIDNPMIRNIPDDDEVIINNFPSITPSSGVKTNTIQIIP